MKITQRVFDISWRVAILAVPWQTRWFSDAWLAGWPWEQGRLSFYLSWIPMILVIIFSFCDRVHQPEDKQKKWTWLGLGALLVLSALNMIRDHATSQPIFQWWFQVGILALFVRALRRASISPRSIATWFAISLIPHALLGIWQFISQHVIGTKWLGIATQFPQTLGVSVVAHNGVRILRSYGGFPHPNIFGGWLAVGALVSVWLALTSMKRRDGIMWTVVSSLFMSALVLTFARGAWLAAAVGFVTLFVGAHAIRPIGGRVPHALTRRFVIILPLLVFALVLVTQRQHVFARFDFTQRLEQKSVDERVGSFRMGVDLFLRHPMIGAGPNAELLTHASTEKAVAPLEPPHNVFLLALDDFGIIGFIAITILFIGILRVGAKDPLFRYPFVVALAIPVLFDHYPWSTWSGQALVATVILFTIESKIDP